MWLQIAAVSELLTRASLQAIPSCHVCACTHGVLGVETLHSGANALLVSGVEYIAFESVCMCVDLMSPCVCV